MVLGNLLRRLLAGGDSFRAGSLAVLRRLADPLFGVMFGVCVILLFFGFVERRTRGHVDHRQICAVQRFIERRYEIDVKYRTESKAVLAARREALREFQRDARVEC